MKKALKLSITIYFIIFTIFILNACSLNLSLGGIDMLQAPKLPERFQRVRNAMDKSISGSYHLIYALRGDDSSAVRFSDLNGDGINEAIAVYIQSGVSDSIWIHILSQEYGDWEKQFDFGVEGIDCDIIDFSDFDGDGNNEMLIGRKTSDSGNNLLSIYDFTDTPQEIFTSYYSELIVDDLTQDEKKDVFYISPDKASGVVEGRLASIQNGDMQVIATCGMDVAVSRYESIKKGYIKSGFPALFVDGIKGVNAGVNELIYYQDGQLINTFFDSKKNTTEITYKSYNIVSRDIDSDGITEIPLLTQAESYDQEANNDFALKIDWCKYNLETNKLDFVSSMLFNPLSEYSIILTEKWIDKITIHTENNGRTWMIYSKGSEKNKPELLYTIWSGKPSDITVQNINYDKQLRNTAQNVVVLKVEQVSEYAKPLLFTEDEINTLIVFTDLRKGEYWYEKNISNG